MNSFSPGVTSLPADTSTLATSALRTAGLNAVTAPTFTFSATLTYEVEPEPTLLSLLTVSLVPLVRKRNRRTSH